MNPVLWALAANFCFAFASIFYANFSERFGALWMNIVKASIGFLGFTVILLTLGKGLHHLEIKTILILFVSGVIGFGIGDMLLLNAFRILGPGRTLILFGFQPITVGLMSYLILGQELEVKSFITILFFILCLMSFSVERFKATKSWGVIGLSLAIVGVLLDSTGNVLTRLAFDSEAGLTVVQTNVIRMLGGLSVYLIYSLFIEKPKIFEKIGTLESKQKLILFIACVMGTFLSLLMYMKAIKTGTLAVISGIGITGPLFSTMLEHVFEKKLPSRYMILAIFFFVIGFAFSQGWITN